MSLLRKRVSLSLLGSCRVAKGEVGASEAVGFKGYSCRALGFRDIIWGLYKDNG